MMAAARQKSGDLAFGAGNPEFGGRLFRFRAGVGGRSCDLGRLPFSPDAACGAAGCI